MGNLGGYQRMTEPARKVGGPKVLVAMTLVIGYVGIRLPEARPAWQADGLCKEHLIVIGTDGLHTIVEVKMNKEMTSEEVIAKRDAAKRWANHVNADEQVKNKWRYLLASETDVKTARGSWDALQGLAS